jgi:Disulfide bond isomerase protein N-terminus
MPSTISRAATIIALALLALTAHADERVIRKVFKSKLPDAKVLSVQKLPYAGLYEVAVQREDGARITSKAPGRKRSARCRRK